jgi:hypothetical protein
MPRHALLARTPVSSVNAINLKVISLYRRTITASSRLVATSSIMRRLPPVMGKAADRKGWKVCNPLPPIHKTSRILRSASANECKCVYPNAAPVYWPRCSWFGVEFAISVVVPCNSHGQSFLELARPVTIQDLEASTLWQGSQQIRADKYPPVAPEPREPALHPTWLHVLTGYARPLVAHNILWLYLSLRVCLRYCVQRLCCFTSSALSLALCLDRMGASNEISRDSLRSCSSRLGRRMSVG